MVNILKINIALAPTLHNDMLIIKDELQLETCPGDVDDVMSRHRGVG